jgi:AraC-like DNA-binding protein
VGQLATEAGMSVATFHDHFRAITGTSPMQYVKSTRLHQARLLMLRQGMTAEAASLAVGYASPSQFNREFKRLFAQRCRRPRWRGCGAVSRCHLRQRMRRTCLRIEEFERAWPGAGLKRVSSAGAGPCPASPARD